MKPTKDSSAQEVFDYIIAHLFSMKTRAMIEIKNEWVCAYRNDQGESCAAGCLIADEEYHKGMEGLDWSKVCKLTSWDWEHFILIQKMQGCHDSLTSWTATGFGSKICVSNLREVAYDHNLKLNIPKP